MTYELLLKNLGRFCWIDGISQVIVIFKYQKAFHVRGGIRLLLYRP